MPLHGSTVKPLRCLLIVLGHLHSISVHRTEIVLGRGISFFSKLSELKEGGCVVPLFIRPDSLFKFNILAHVWSRNQMDEQSQQSLQQILDGRLHQRSSLRKE